MVKLGGFVALLWLGVLLGTPDSSVTSATGDLRELPHRRDRLVIDGDLDDWRGPRLEVQLAEPEAPAPWANRGTFFLTWDASHLWFAARIHDTEVYPAPSSITGAALYQWDSVELYVDGRGDRSPRMDEDDTQLIVACDGRHGAMQGDELLRSVEDWEVPKRERRGLAVRAAARRTADGYVVEGAFPLAAVDVAEARAGQVLALDLGWNDWIEDHPRLPELLKDLENLALLAHRDSASEVAIVDPDSLGWGGLLAWEARAYRAWSWSNGRDFGHPRTWRRVHLVGAPTLAERLTARWGPLPLLGGGFLIALAVALAIDLQLRRRQRRRIRELLARVEALTGGVGGEASQTGSGAELQLRDRRPRGRRPPPPPTGPGPGSTASPTGSPSPRSRTRTTTRPTSWAACWPTPAPTWTRPCR